MLHCVPTPPGSPYVHSVICSHLDVGHNFLESFLATSLNIFYRLNNLQWGWAFTIGLGAIYGFARFFGQRFPTEESLLPQLGI